MGSFTNSETVKGTARLGFVLPLQRRLMAPHSLSIVQITLTHRPAADERKDVPGVMRRTWDLGDLVWFPVTSVKLAGLWVQVPRLRNELHFPVSEGHCGGNALVMVKHQVIVHECILAAKGSRCTVWQWDTHGPLQKNKQGTTHLQWGYVSKRAQVQLPP